MTHRTLVSSNHEWPFHSAVDPLNAYGPRRCLEHLFEARRLLLRLAGEQRIPQALMVPFVVVVRHVHWLAPLPLALASLHVRVGPRCFDDTVWQPDFHQPDLRAYVLGSVGQQIPVVCFRVDFLDPGKLTGVRRLHRGPSIRAKLQLGEFDLAGRIGVNHQQG